MKLFIIVFCVSWFPLLIAMAKIEPPKDDSDIRAWFFAAFAVCVIWSSFVWGIVESFRYIAGGLQ